MRLSPDVVYRRVNDELLVLNLGVSRYFQVNPSGTLLWEMLGDDQAATEDDLVNALTGAFDVDDETATADVRAFLDALRTMGALIE